MKEWSRFHPNFAYRKKESLTVRLCLSFTSGVKKDEKSNKRDLKTRESDSPTAIEPNTNHKRLASKSAISIAVPRIILSEFAVLMIIASPRLISVFEQHGIVVHFLRRHDQNQR